MREDKNLNLRGKPFTVGLVVAVPAAEGGVAGVGKQKLQRRRFNVAVAEDYVGFALVAGGGVPVFFLALQVSAHDCDAAAKIFGYCDHVAWSGHF